MSDFVSKTVGTLSGLLGNVGISDERSGGKVFPSSQSFDTSSFMRKMKNAISRKEEEEIVTSYLSAAEKVLSQPNVKENDVEHCVKLAMVCESLGYPARFSYVHAIKLAQKGNLQQKHTGYLAAASLLGPKHELIILLINTIQKDLESTHEAEVVLGLKAVCNLICRDNVHNVVHLVKDRLTHRMPEVRKLAVFALNHCLMTIDNESAYKLALPQVENALCDTDLDVAAAAVPLLYKIIKECPGDYSYLIDSMMHLQSQLLQSHIPREMEYQCLPAPWLQIKVLQFFPLLCDDLKKSEKVFPLLKETLLKAEITHDICYAIVAELIKTVISMPHTEEMLELVLSSATKLLNSENANLKYTGIQTFVFIVQKTKPKLTISHQESIMACLNHPDNMLKKKALDLLYFLANPLNAEAVCKKLTEILNEDSTEKNMKKDLAIKVLQIAKQYNVDNKWYINTINEILTIAGNLLDETDINDIAVYVLNESTGALKKEVKRVYLEMCQKNTLQEGMIKILAAVLDHPNEFQEVLSQVFTSADESSLLWLMIFLQNLILKHGTAPDNLSDLLKSRKFEMKELKIAVDETINLIGDLDSLKDFKYTTEIDMTLSFLDEFVNEELLKGAECFMPKSLRTAPEQSNFDYMGKFSTKSTSSSFPGDAESLRIDSSSAKSLSFTSLSSSSLPTSSFTPSSDTNLKTRYVWTEKGRIKVPEEVDVKKEEEPSTGAKPKDTVTTDQLFAGLPS